MKIKAQVPRGESDKFCGRTRQVLWQLSKNNEHGKNIVDLLDEDVNHAMNAAFREGIKYGILNRESLEQDKE